MDIYRLPEAPPSCSWSVRFIQKLLTVFLPPPTIAANSSLATLAASKVCAPKQKIVEYKNLQNYPTLEEAIP